MVFVSFSCTNTEDDILYGKGNLSLEFDNSYGDSDLILNTTSYLANETEKIKISKVTYIISNIRLEKADGTIFTYPKNDSYFIVDEFVNSSQFISLSNIPEGDYTKITFGIGVDQEKYLEGATGQGNFLTLAQDAEMMWSWQAGYKFLVFEGEYTSINSPTPSAFAFHMGSHGKVLDNYREVTLSLPNSARIRTDKIPEIHVVSNVFYILSGSTKFLLDEGSQIHVDALKSPKIANNTSEMFYIDHVHN